MHVVHKGDLPVRDGHGLRRKLHELPHGRLYRYRWPHCLHSVYYRLVHAHVCCDSVPHVRRRVVRERVWIMRELRAEAVERCGIHLAECVYGLRRAERQRAEDRGRASDSHAQHGRAGLQRAQVCSDRGYYSHVQQGRRGRCSGSGRGWQWWIQRGRGRWGWCRLVLWRHQVFESDHVLVLCRGWRWTDNNSSGWKSWPSQCHNEFRGHHNALFCIRGRRWRAAWERGREWRLRGRRWWKYCSKGWGHCHV